MEPDRQTRKDLFQHFPVIQDEIMKLRCIQKGDALQLKDLYDHTLDEAHALQLEAECMRWYQERKEIAAGIFTMDGTLAGILEIYDITKDSVTIGYRIKSRLRKRGYMTHAVNLLKEYLAENTEICNILAAADAENTASLRVLEKCGFIQLKTNGNIHEYICHLSPKTMVE